MVQHTTACKVALVAMLGVVVVALPEGWRMRLVMGSLLRMVLAHLHLAPPLQLCLHREDQQWRAVKAPQPRRPPRELTGQMAGQLG